MKEELHNLDILDASFPCSVFSIAGDRQKAWGKEKVFREGQKAQRLDDLAFYSIDLAKELKPKVVVFENVQGLLQGEAIEYVKEIYRQMNDAGYILQHWLLMHVTWVFLKTDLWYSLLGYVKTFARRLWFKRICSSECLR